MMRKNQKVMIGGLLAIFFLIRAGEFVVDYVIGDQNGHFSSPVLVWGMTGVYSIILMAILVGVMWELQQVVASQYNRVLAKKYGHLTIPGVLGAMLIWGGIYWGLSFMALSINRRFLSNDMPWQKALVVLLFAIAPLMLPPWFALTLKQRKYIMNLVGLLYFSALLLYITVVLCNFFLYNYGHRVPGLNSVTRSYYFSMGIFNQANNPRYRKEFHGFVPASQRVVGHPGDIFAIYGLPLDPLEVSWSVPDTLGWPNVHSLPEADVLFIGDSFARGNAAGFENSIPVRFEKLTGRKVYNASNEGYGLPQYLEILRYLTKDFPDQTTRFQGKEVYMLLCLENDLGLDLIQFQERVAEEQRTSRFAYKLGFYMKLEAICRLISFARYISEQGVATKREEYPLATPADRAMIEQEKRRTQGWYPHFLTLPHYQGMSFAFFRGNLIEFADITWLDQQEEYILKTLREIHDIADESGLQVRFVVLPTTLQIVAPYLDPLPSNSALEFDRLFPTILNNLNTAHDAIMQHLRKSGFEVIDVKPLFDKDILSQTLVWPGDIHYTPEGYALIAESMATTFYQTRGY